MSLKNGILKMKIHSLCIFFFISSLLFAPLALVMYAGLVYLTYKEGIKGAIQSMIILTFRGILSTAVAVSVGGYNTLKLILILFLSFYIMYNSLNITKNRKMKIILIGVLVFSFFSIVASFISGSYPISSSFKVISFFMTFLSILYGIYKTRNQFDWLNYIYKWFTYLMVVSFFLIPFNRFRIINTNFQGVFNHVNVMGVIGALYISILLIKKDVSNKIILNVLILMTLIMQYLTASRTGLIISISCLLIYEITHISIKRCIIALIPIFLFLFAYNLNTKVHKYINSQVTSYIYKGNQNDILSSRRGLQKISQIKYENNKICGSGFMMPFSKNVKNYSLEMGGFYEPGNLFLMLIGDTGIIGLILFIVFLFMLILSGKLKNIYLIISSFGICMGEMVFFSVNNFSILIYVILALYITIKIRENGHFS